MRIGDIRFDLEDFHGPHEAGMALLPEPDDVGEPLHRIDQHADRQEEGQHVGERQFAPAHAQGTDNDDDDDDELRKAVGAQRKPGLAAVAVTPAVEKAPVVAGEAPALQRLVGEGLHHADAAQGILHPLVDGGDLFLAARQRPVHAAVEVERIEHGERHQQGDAARQRRIDIDQHRHGAGELEHGDGKVFRAVMEELPKPQRVVGDAAHQLPGAGAVMKAEAELLGVLEQLLADIRLDPRAHHVALIVDKEAGRDLHRQQEEHDPPGEKNLVQHLGAVGKGNQPGGDDIGDQRLCHCHSSNHQRGRKVCREQRQVRSVIGEEFAPALLAGGKARMRGARPRAGDRRHGSGCP